LYVKGTSRREGTLLSCHGGGESEGKKVSSQAPQLVQQQAEGRK